MTLDYSDLKEKLGRMSLSDLTDIFGEDEKKKRVLSLGDETVYDKKVGEYLTKTFHIWGVLDDVGDYLAKSIYELMFSIDNDIEASRALYETAMSRIAEYDFSTMKPLVSRRTRRCYERRLTALEELGIIV